MKYLLFTIIAISSLNSFAKTNTNRNPSSNGSAEVVIQVNNNWIRIDGEAAKELYAAMTVPEKNNQGQAGADVYFKTGKSYDCWMEKGTNNNSNYACTITIADPGKAIIR